MNDQRRELLHTLLRLDCPLDELLPALRRLPWDSPQELAVLRREHVLGVLDRFLRGQLSAQDLEQWANAIEMREDIGFEPASRDLLPEVIFELANPTINEAITVTFAERWVRRLRAD